jgi:hypothetical protein
MKYRKRTLANPWNPMFGSQQLWLDLATRNTEMLMAAAQVITHRTQRMAAAGPQPNARDRREFARMGSEKVDAARESATAMGAQMMALPWDLGLRWWQAASRASAAAGALGASRTPAQALARGKTLANALQATGHAAAHASSAGARVAGRGLAPIHAKATANARRLSKG